MLPVRVAILVLAFVIAVSGQVSRHPPSTNPEFPGHCWLEEFKQAVKGGEEWTDREKCARYTCFANDFSYEIGGCGKIHVSDPNCALTAVDKTKDYPDCCPKISCK
ncbi:hypothetical protein DMENIID0001_032580 [Sergentomyia squamirostris]